MILRWLIGLIGLALVLWLLPEAERAEPVEEYHVAMGTIVRLALYVDEQEAPRLFAVARDEIDRLAASLTHYEAAGAGDLERVNREAASGWVEMPADLAEVLRRSLELAQQTGGAFDPALGPLTRLWGFPEARRPPAAAVIDSVLALCGAGGVELDGRRVRFTHPGVRLDLGAGAKGYVVDRAVAALQQAGAAAGVVEAGGDLRFWGRKPDGRDWRFGVQHPRQDRIIPVEDTGLPALATSGDYEQTFEVDGVRYHHLLDPDTGWPARKAVSATVWARSAMEADALATAAFVAGPQRALEWAAAADSLEVMIYYESGDSLVRAISDGLKGRLGGS